MPTKKRTTKERERTEVTTFEEIEFSREEVMAALREKYDLGGYTFVRLALGGIFLTSAPFIARKEVDKEIQ